MKRVNVSDHAISGVNIVPVIGVTLVLLVILIVMSPIMNLPDLTVDLPEAMTKESKEQNVTISMGSDGRVSLAQEIIPWKKLPGLLRAELNDKPKDTVVIIRADKDLEYGMVEKLVRIANQNSLGHGVALATRQRVTTLEGTIE